LKYRVPAGASYMVRVDHLEERGLIERRRNPDDRRHYALFLTSEGGQFLRTKLGPSSARRRGRRNNLVGQLAGRRPSWSCLAS
jgi:DNA-binding MarR family transcriptional regulator